MEHTFKVENGRVECTLHIKDGLVFKGVAKTHPDDKFLESTGKKIAANRASQKMLKWENKMMEKEIEQNRLIIEAFDQMNSEADISTQIYFARLERARKKLSR